MSDQDRGLYSKYKVERIGDETGKHDGCWYFVLDPIHDKFASHALMAYAMACRDEYPVLSQDLIDLVLDYV